LALYLPESIEGDSVTSKWPVSWPRF